MTKENGNTGRVSESIRSVSARRDHKKQDNFRETVLYILNSSLLVGISGISWTAEGKPINLPRLEDFGAQKNSQPITVTPEEDMPRDDPRASIYVQGRFDADPKGNIVFSTRRVPSSVFRVLDKPK